MLEGYAHQVAGHKEEALLGISNRLVLKPLVKKDLFARESTFYLRAADAKHDTNSVLRFTAGFFGILYCNSCRDPSTLSLAAQEERETNNSLLPHIVLEDLTFGYSTPNVIDIKMGTCTFEPTASQKKKDREQLKYPYQAELGFRVTGFKVFDIESSTYTTAGKPFGRSILPSEVIPALALLFHNGGKVFRSDVIKSVITQLECIRLWMLSQTRYKFYCTSLLIVFDAHFAGAGAVTSRGGLEQGQVAADEHKGDSIGSSTDMMTTHVGPAGPETAAIAGTAGTGAIMIGNSASFNDHSSSGSCSGGKVGEPVARSICTVSNSSEVLGRIEHFLQSSPIEPPLVRVKMIDFAHVVESATDNDNKALGVDNSAGTSSSGNGMIDEGYIHGLTRLIQSLHNVLEHINAVTLSGELSSRLHSEMEFLLQRVKTLAV